MSGKSRTITISEAQLDHAAELYEQLGLIIVPGEISWATLSCEIEIDAIKAKLAELTDLFNEYDSEKSQ